MIHNNYYTNSEQRQSQSSGQEQAYDFDGTSAASAGGHAAGGHWRVSGRLGIAGGLSPNGKQYLSGSSCIFYQAGGILPPGHKGPGSGTLTGDWDPATGDLAFHVSVPGQPGWEGYTWRAKLMTGDAELDVFQHSGAAPQAWSMKLRLRHVSMESPWQPPAASEPAAEPASESVPRSLPQRWPPPSLTLSPEVIIYQLMYAFTKSEGVDALEQVICKTGGSMSADGKTQFANSDQLRSFAAALESVLVDAVREGTPKLWNSEWPKLWNAETVRRLLDNGANLEGQDSSGYSPLRAAVMFDRLPALVMLLAKGANVDAQDPDGLTALHIAAKMGRDDMMKRLLDYGATTTLKTKQKTTNDGKTTGGETALDEAKSPVAGMKMFGVRQDSKQRCAALLEAR